MNRQEENNKKVCIIVPVYNTPDYVINSFFKSVMSQTNSDYILLFVDDGSKNKNTIQCLNQYSKNKSTIVLHKKNGGAASARNYGIIYNREVLKCELVMFCDSDDILNSQSIEILMKAYETTNADIVVSNTGVFDKYNSIIFDNSNNCKYSVDDTFNALHNLNNNNYPNLVMGKLYKASLLFNCMFNEELRFGDDTDFLYRVFPISIKNTFTNYISYYLNRDPSLQSICKTKNLTNKQILSAIKVNITILNAKLDNIHPQKKNPMIRELQSVSSDAFLELIPRFSKKIANENDKQEYKALCELINRSKCIWHYKPYNVRSFIKKITYLLFPLVYYNLYRLYLKMVTKRYGIAIR